jgi:hypothetical protein
MSTEQTLLLQVLRRARCQQDLIVQVQKSLKVLANIEKNMGKTTKQVKQLQQPLKILKNRFYTNTAPNCNGRAITREKLSEVGERKEAISSIGKC